MPTTQPLAPFDFNGSAVRVHLDDQGNPWFVAKDVAEVLGYRDAHTASRYLAPGQRGEAVVPVGGNKLPALAQDGTPIQCTSSENRRVATVSESGLYTLVMHSRVEAARPFKRWVTEDVLPSIRKTGSYGVTNETPEMKLLAGVRWLQSKCEDQAKRLAVAEPKAEAFDAYVDAPGSMSLREAAHHLGQKQNDFITRLLDEGYLYRQRTRNPKRQVLRPYSKWVGVGVFVDRFVPGVEFLQVLVTRKGLGELAALYGRPLQGTLRLAEPAGRSIGGES